MENVITLNKEINKKEAIIILESMDYYFPSEERALNMAIKSLEVGKPIIKKADYLLYGLEVYLYECPRCGTTWKERFNFCPECGLDMRESEVEE